jgi:hypothetical protein
MIPTKSYAIHLIGHTMFHLKINNLLQLNECFLVNFSGSFRVGQTFKVGFLALFVGGPYCLGCLKSRWSHSLNAFVALKIGKNGLEARKLWLPEIRGGLF